MADWVVGRMRSVSRKKQCRMRPDDAMLHELVKGCSPDKVQVLSFKRRCKRVQGECLAFRSPDSRCRGHMQATEELERAMGSHLSLPKCKPY